MEPLLDVLVPTYARPAALAVTLTSLIGQTFRDFRVLISDQTEDGDVEDTGEVRAVLRILRAQGRPAEIGKHLPRRGMAEHRQHLLDLSSAHYVLYLDDDVVLETDVLERMWEVIAADGCGFVGCAVIGLSFADEVRPHEQHIEFWDGPVRPELVEFGTPAWERHKLHSAANLYHVARRLRITSERQRRYRVAWVGGCVLYDRAKLLDAGGFGFWRQLPSEHSGEDVLAQLRVMAKYGGCGLIPSGVYHQELPTTVRDRIVDAPRVLPVLALRPLRPSGPIPPQRGRGR